MSRRNRIVLVIMVLIGMGIFAYSLRNVALTQLLHDLVHINVWWLLVAIGCMVGYLLIEARIVQVFVNDRLSGFTFKDALRIPLIEQLFNGITPFSSGGQPAQLVAMIQTGVDGGRASSVLLMKFVVYQAMIVINFLIALAIGFQFLAAKLHYFALFVVFGFLIHLVVIVGLLMIMFWHSFTKRLVNLCLKPARWFVKPERYENWRITLDEKIDSFYHESVRIKSQWRLMLHVTLLTLGQLAIYYLIPYFIMLSLGYHHVNVLMVTALHILIVMVISLFPIPGGAGGAEFSFEALFASYVTTRSKLVLAMILWRVITYYLGLFAGMWAIALKPDKVSEEPRENHRILHRLRNKS
ncbi:lysylphosphatidylglycerol synthase transmembrane domain-containing protein [Furfurilactobacillus siliginis]|uniref:Phosphatidylglycerol lysyltransferase n=2 Tax=Furfurilactobacillus siliginis TaxID=348151 RepID=A0A510VMY6_9LACO|nr:lysylphosphatidylglycerol synthase transmembrane domain-containing protein [Furfurilactobacillus siliginis]GEK28303.1 phosphatidylglycerol lysyltransferase [Furfurilactobacillus siliginis]